MTRTIERTPLDYLDYDSSFVIGLSTSRTSSIYATASISYALSIRRSSNSPMTTTITLDSTKPTIESRLAFTSRTLLRNFKIILGTTYLIM